MSTITVNKWTNTQPFTVIEKGNRGSLHPDLNVLDTINCVVTYYKRQRLIMVDYDYDSENDKYQKSIFSTVVKNIRVDIDSFIQGLDI
jgi:hypothetical protein